MGKQGKTDFYNMAVFSLGRAILLVCVRTRDVMGNANFIKKGIKRLVLATPIRLNHKNFASKLALYKGLERMKAFEYLRFMTN
jgi:hypothetical protein